MISQELKTHVHTGEPVIQEYSALMNATFAYYRETRELFFDKLPDHLQQSELVSLLNGPLRNRLFDESFCETIPQAIKAIQRIIIRLEDLQAHHPHISEAFSNLARLIQLAERVTMLYQLHWEHYRYREHSQERELVLFLLKIDAIAREWEKFQAAHVTLRTLVDALSGMPPPEGFVSLDVSYQRQGPAHFAVETLKALLDFFSAGYRYVCAVRGIDAEACPLRLLQVEMSAPVELRLGVHQDAEAALRRLLQYLFLKDMLRGENLLRFVCEAISKDFGNSKAPASAAATRFQKELAAALKQLPVDGTFTISDRTFPDEGILVLQEFSRYLEEKKIKSDALLKAKTRGKTSGSAARQPPLPVEPPALDKGEQKAHIQVLTERSG